MLTKTQPAVSAGLMPSRVRSLLRLLDGADDVYSLSLGGSYTTVLATPTSDIDLFFIGPSSLAQRLEAAFYSTRGYDLECRDIQWLEDISGRLSTYMANIAQELPPFSAEDLRFLVRVNRGRFVRTNTDIGAALGSAKDGLWRACAGHAGVFYAVLYQDVFGLLLADRPREALPLGGELIQRACLSALYQRGIVADFAPKWAVAAAQAGAAGRTVATNVGQTLSHLGEYASYAEKADWVELLLRGANTIVAAAIVERLQAGQSPPPANRDRICMDLKYAPVAALSGSALYDVLERVVVGCNVYTLASMAALPW